MDLNFIVGKNKFQKREDSGLSHFQFIKRGKKKSFIFNLLRSINAKKWIFLSLRYL